MSADDLSLEKHRLLLEARARDLARPQDTITPRELLYHVVLLKLDENTIGLPIDYVREIVRPPPITPLFGMPLWFSGVICLHAQILSVIDLGLWLGIGSRSPRNALAVLCGPDGDIGALVDNCIGFRPVHADEIVPAAGHVESSPLPSTLAITRDLCTIINVPKLVGDPRLRFGTHSQTTPAAGDQS